MSKNFDQFPEANALGGTETFPLNQAGATKFATINKIVTFLGTVFDAIGTAASEVASHLAFYDHAAINHTNRAALDLVAGTNTGDQDLSGYISRTSNITTDKNIVVGTNTIEPSWSDFTSGVLQLGWAEKMFFVGNGLYYNCYLTNDLSIRYVANGYAAYTVLTPTGFIWKVSAYGLKDAIVTFAAASLMELKSDGLHISGIHCNDIIAANYIATPFLDMTGDIQMQANSNLRFHLANTGIQYNEVANGKFGQATLVAGTKTIDSTSIKTTSRIFLTVAAAGGTQGHLRTTIVNGTSFTITSTSASETSVVNWFIVDLIP